MTDVIISLGALGRLRGARLSGSGGVCKFLGVPYALPPTGARRWKKPEQLPAGFLYDQDSEEPRDCTRFGDVCPQEIYMLNGVPYNMLRGSAYSEDCLNVNIWTPAEKPAPGEQWPVLAFIHGGWLQVGSPSVTPDYMHPHELLAPDADGSAPLRAVVVSIGYRLNLFGFLAGNGLQGNFGFWDQRAALQWIQANIHFFGGDPAAVTLFGHSAGGFSAHTQLQYELLHTDGSKPLFNNVFLCSNAIPAQPKTIAEATAQFEDLCTTTGVPAALSAAEKLAHLRTIPASELVKALPKLKMSNFRAVTDDDMIRPDMVERFQDGTFANVFKERGYRLLCGETETEQHLYSQWLPPRSAAELPAKLQNYYPARVAEKLLAHPDYRLDADNSNVVSVFSRIVSDMQVRAPIRLLCRQLLEAGVPPSRVMRYRVAFRPEFFDDIYPPEAGVTHGADMFIWWAAKRYGYTAQEWSALKAWLSASIGKLVSGEDFAPGAGAKDSYVLFGPDGKTGVVQDQYWDHLMSVVEAVSE